MLTLLKKILCSALEKRVVHSKFDDRSYDDFPPDLTDEEKRCKESLHTHLHHLCNVIGERNFHRIESFKRTLEYFREFFAGLNGGIIKTHEMKIHGEIYRNFIYEIPGEGSKKDDIILIGAHYDTVSFSPGGNDNGTGVATVLELARHYATSDHKPGCTLRFVLFANEEVPFFHTTNMGSYRYAQSCSQKGDNLRAVIIIDSIGCYTRTGNSQNFPFPMNEFFPSTGNFLAFLGNNKSRGLLNHSISSFRAVGKIPSAGFTAPGWLPEVGWSDHWSFWQFNYPAILLTDTALYRYFHYHTPQDTLEKLDMVTLARVFSGLRYLVGELKNYGLHF